MSKTIDINELASQLGFSIDEADPVGSMKRAADALRERAEKKDDQAADMDARLKGIEEALKGLTNKPEPIETPAPKGDSVPDTGRRAADALSRVKVMPASHEMDRVLDRPAQDDDEKALHQWSDACYLMSRTRGLESPRSLAYWRETIERSPALQKAITSDASPVSDWVPTGFSAEVYQAIRMKCLIANQFRTLDYTGMAGDTFKLPWKASVGTAYLTSQATDKTLTNLTSSAALTVQFKGFGYACAIAQEAEEDSIVPVMPAVLDDLATVLAESREQAILDGAVTPQDSDHTASEDIRSAWDGIRLLTLAVSGLKADGGTFDKTTLRPIRKAMGKYGMNPNDLFWVTGPAGWFSFLNVAEMLDWSKIGQLPTLVTGTIGMFDGVPILPSGQIREDLNTSGVFDNSTKDNTVVHIVNKQRWLNAEKRRITIEDQRFILGDYSIVVAKARWGFLPIATPSASNQIAATLYNVAV